MAILCANDNLLFIMAPRTGCTAIGDLLLEQLHGQWLPEEDILDSSGHYVMSHKHNTLEAILAHGLISPAQREQLFVFTAVRNPFDSLVSLYTKKATICHEYAKDPTEYVHKMPRYLEDMEYCATHSFEQWIHHRFEPPLLRRLRGRRRRTLYMKFVKGADAVMRFERLQDDFRDVLHRAGVRASLEIPSVNVTNDREQDYRSYYSPKSRKIIERAFAEELRELEYQF